MRKLLICLPLVLLIIAGAAPAADFDGDGTGDIAIYRESSGLWAVREVTRVYFGGSGDDPVPGDYDGGCRDSIAIFRGTSGLWAVRDVTRVYFGGSSDQPRPGDYDGDRTDDFGIFRPASGMWAVRGITRVYFGSSGDTAISPGKAPWPIRGQLPVTGQTSAWQVGDDGYIEAGSPFSFKMSISAGDQLTLDRNTGLMWAADGNARGGSFGQQTDWNAAIDWCNNLSFGGYTDWRLPNARELQSICDYGTNYPPINTTYFPNTRTSRYWTSSTYTTNSLYAWSLGFTTGRFYASSEKTTDTEYLRAVRGL